MQDAARRRLRELCELAVEEEDAERVLSLLQEINRILDELEEEAKKGRQGPG